MSTISTPSPSSTSWPARFPHVPILGDNGIPPTQAFQEWRRNYLRVAKTILPGKDLTPWITSTDGAAPFVPLAFQPDPADIPNNIEGDRILKATDRHNSQFKEEATALTSMAELLLSGISKSIRGMLDTSIGGQPHAADNATARTLYTILHTAYGIISGEDLSSLRDSNLVPYIHQNATSYLDHVNRYADVFHHHSNAGEAHRMSEAMKIDYLEKSLRVSSIGHLIRETIEAWHRTYPITDAQSHNFIHFSTYLKFTVDRLNASTPSAYTAQAHARRPDTPQRQRDRSSSPSAARSSPSTPAANSRQVRFRNTGTIQYCWTHGSGFHNSAACKTRAAGHDQHLTATHLLPQGGKAPNLALH